jgi:hypothetical protein
VKADPLIRVNDGRWQNFKSFFGNTRERKRR